MVWTSSVVPMIRAFPIVWSKTTNSRFSVPMTKKHISETKAASNMRFSTHLEVIKIYFRYQPTVCVTTPTSGLDVRTLLDSPSNIFETPAPGMSKLGRLICLMEPKLYSLLPDTLVNTFEKYRVLKFGTSDLAVIFEPGYTAIP